MGTSAGEEPNAPSNPSQCLRITKITNENYEYKKQIECGGEGGVKRSSWREERREQNARREKT